MGKTYLDWETPEGVYEMSHEEIEEHVAKLMKEQITDPFDDLAKEIHPTNVEKGFWSEPVMMDKYAAKLALIHSEVTEVLEALRKSQGPEKVTEEFADIFIRCFDLYGTLVEAGEADPWLYDVMREKMKANKERPVKHGNRWG
jgi:NTP pyrophosphatase (non-canonical NTP hydrolase)